MKQACTSGAVRRVLLSLALGLVASNAQATPFSGTVVRSVLPRAAPSSWARISTLSPDDYNWEPVLGVSDDGCGVQSVGASTSFSIPYESSVAESGTLPTVTLAVHGTDAATGSQVCAVSYAFDSSGNLFSVSNGGHVQCSMGTSLSPQVLTTSDLPVPADGSIVTAVSAGGYATLDMLALTFTVHSN